MARIVWQDSADGADRIAILESGLKVRILRFAQAIGTARTAGTSDKVPKFAAIDEWTILIHVGGSPVATFGALYRYKSLKKAEKAVEELAVAFGSLATDAKGTTEG